MLTKCTWQTFPTDGYDQQLSCKPYIKCTLDAGVSLLYNIQHEGIAHLVKILAAIILHS